MNGQQVGYIRVSAADQHADRQLEGVTPDKVFEEKLTGSVRERPGLSACLDYLREGDTLHVHSIDRLARNLLHLQQLVEGLTARGVSVVFHKEGMTFDARAVDPLQRLMFQMLGAFAEFERTLIRERQKEGIAAARAKGKPLGRPRRADGKLLEELLAQLSAGSKPSELAKRYGIPRTTMYGYRKRLQTYPAEPKRNEEDASV